MDAEAPAIRQAGFQPAPLNHLPGEASSPGQAFFVRTEDGLRLRLGLWSPEGTAIGTVLLFPGRTEYLEKYAPLAGRLAAEGFAVLAIDWRGQGLSDRLLADPRAGHITDFADYQTDVVEMVVAADAMGLPRPWHLLSHSMGGCIGLAALLNGLPVRTAALSAPMWGLHHPRVPDAVIAGLTGTVRRLGHAGQTAIGTGGGGTYLLDEPDAALSFGGSLALVTVLLDLVASGAQVVVATHSPVVAALPGARLVEVGDWGMRPAQWDELELTVDWRQFLTDPAAYLRHLR